MKKYAAILMALTTILAMLCSCSKSNENSIQSDSQADSSEVSVINPMECVSAEKLAEETGISLSAPADAVNAVYYVVNTGDDRKMAQVDFTYHDRPFTYRAEATEKLEAYDMTGLYYTWEEEKAVEVSYCPAMLMLCKEAAGLYWLDIVPGVNYSLGCSMESAEEEMLEVANLVCKSLQGDSEETSEEATDHSNQNAAGNKPTKPDANSDADHAQTTSTDTCDLSVDYFDSFDAAVTHTENYLATLSGGSSLFIETPLIGSNFEVHHYTVDHGTDHYLFVFYNDGRMAALTLPYADGAFRHAAPEKLVLKDSVVSYEVNHTDRVVSASTGYVQQEAGSYQYTANLAKRTFESSFTADTVDANAASGYEYRGRPLSAGPSEYSYEELIAWLNASDSDTVTESTYFIPEGYLNDNCGDVVYYGSWAGTPHPSYIDMYLFFADGTEALLELPNGGGFDRVLPSYQCFSETDHTFIYEVNAPAQTMSGATIDGVYRFTVDLDAKTVSLEIV